MKVFIVTRTDYDHRSHCTHIDKIFYNKDKAEDYRKSEVAYQDIFGPRDRLKATYPPVTHSWWDLHEHEIK